jgi:sn-glycerol 3-phosphate transport system substrate-binding protein
MPAPLPTRCSPTVRSRRVRGIVATGVALSLLAAACGGSDDTTAAPGGDPTAPPGDGADLPECPVGAHEDAQGTVEVVVWHTFVARVADTLATLTDEYNASQDQVRVRLESQGQDHEQTLRRYTEAIPTGDLPAVVLVDDPATQFMADSDTVLPAQACFDAAGIDLDGFLDTAVSYYTIDGALQPGVLNLGNALLYYNRSHFAQAGLDPDDPPATLAEVRAAAEAIDAAGIGEVPLVMAMQPWLIEFWITGAGEAVVDEGNGRDGLATASAIENDAAVELYTWFADMVDDGLLNAIPDAEGNVDHFFALGLEQSSMLVQTSSAATSVAAFLEGEEVGAEGDAPVEGAEQIDATGLDIDAGPFPTLREGGTTQVGGTAWYLVADHPDPVIAGAWDWMTFMNQPSSQARWNLDGSFTPWVKATLDDAEMRAAWDDTRLGSWLALAYEQVEDIDPDWPGPLIGPYTEVRSAIRSSLDRLVLRGESPEDALATAATEITRDLDRYADDF